MALSQCGSPMSVGFPIVERTFFSIFSFDPRPRLGVPITLPACRPASVRYLNSNLTFLLFLLLSFPPKRQLRIFKTTGTPSPLGGASHLCNRSTTTAIECPTQSEDQGHELDHLKRKRIVLQTQCQYEMYIRSSKRLVTGSVIIANLRSALLSTGVCNQKRRNSS